MPDPVCGTTVAVNVMVWPVVAAVDDAVSVVVVATTACVTVTLIVADAEALLLLSPL
jgi:hypothetical protein